MNPEEKLEQVANLLALWKECLPGYKEGPYWPGKQLAVGRLELCISQLEAVLTDKPLPPGSSL